MLACQCALLLRLTGQLLHELQCLLREPQLAQLEEGLSDLRALSASRLA